ncbi:GNVR domain-containing protein [Ramlibacter sp.]|uniref:GNVR domain-containing protein n=1 Tax=Ramlibacter sp. TaxID=1917967 RepID=UPI003D0B340C
MTSSEQQAAGEASKDEIGLVDVVTALGEEKMFVATIALIAVALGLALALLTAPIFTAKTTLLPPQQAQGASAAMAASLGALAGLSGVGGVRAPEELYVGLLRSESVLMSLVERFKLKERYGVELAYDARMVLLTRVRVSADRRSSLIAVEVDDKDPNFAAQLANAFAEELRKIMTRIAVTEAQQRRFYFEQQIDKAKSDLANAEMAVKQAQERSGLVSLDAQTQSAIATAAQIRGQIVAREVQLRATRPYAGPENPEMKRLISEIAGLRTELAQLEGGGADTTNVVEKDGKQGLANVRLFRELKYQEAIYSAMLQQLQLARADEAKDAPLVQQVDAATPPERKSKPRRSMIVVVALALGLLVGIIGAFLRRAARRARTDPGTTRQWQALVRAWSLRGG